MPELGLAVASHAEPSVREAIGVEKRKLQQNIEALYATLTPAGASPFVPPPSPFAASTPAVAHVFGSPSTLGTPSPRLPPPTASRAASELAKARDSLEAERARNEQLTLQLAHATAPPQTPGVDAQEHARLEAELRASRADAVALRAQLDEASLAMQRQLDKASSRRGPGGDDLPATLLGELQKFARELTQHAGARGGREARPDSPSGTGERRPSPRAEASPEVASLRSRLAAAEAKASAVSSERDRSREQLRAASAGAGGTAALAEARQKAQALEERLREATAANTAAVASAAKERAVSAELRGALARSEEAMATERRVAESDATAKDATQLALAEAVESKATAEAAAATAEQRRRAAEADAAAAATREQTWQAQFDAQARRLEAQHAEACEALSARAARDLADARQHAERRAAEKLTVRKLSRDAEVAAAARPSASLLRENERLRREVFELKGHGSRRSEEAKAVRFAQLPV